MDAVSAWEIQVNSIIMNNSSIVSFNFCEIGIDVKRGSFFSPPMMSSDDYALFFFDIGNP